MLGDSFVQATVINQNNLCMTVPVGNVMHTSGSCSTSFRPFCKCAMRSLSKLMSRGTDVVKNRIFGRYRKQRITFLPLEVQLNILSFLPPQDVLIAKEVCRTWRHIITRHPTSIQRFPVELKIRKRNDGEREVRVQIMQQSELMKCGRQSFPLRFSIALGELHSYNDFLRHCIVRSIVLDGNPCQTRGKAISTRIGMLDADTIHGVVVLLQQLRNSRRLAELHSFSLISWSVGEGERGMIDEMLRLVLSAPLKAFKVDALCGLQGKLSPEILTSLLGNNIQNLMVDFQYFWKCGARESANYRILDELLSVGAGRRLFLKNIPYADNKVTELAERWSMQELPLFEGRLTLKVTNAQRILPLPRSTKQRFNNRHNKHCFVEISVKNKITVQLQTGTEIHSGSPLNLHITAHSAVEDVFSGEKRTKIHVMNCGSSCIAVNVRMSNRDCKVDPNFFVMFDTKDLYLTAPKKCPQNDTICFECFPFANLATVLFDPAWFSPTATYHEINIPFNQINA